MGCVVRGVPQPASTNNASSAGISKRLTPRIGIVKLLLRRPGEVARSDVDRRCVASAIKQGTCRVLIDSDNPCVSAQGSPLGERANGGVKSAYSAFKMRAIAARTALEASYQALDRLTCAPGRQMTSAGSFDASGSGCPVGLRNL